ncbi:MAG: hypothetical protein ACQEXJ_15815 [Myxococcota bacterium]
MRRRFAVAFALCAVVALASSPAPGVEPVDSTPNTCTDAGGRGTPCTEDADCAQNLFATVCVETGDGGGRCEAPCESEGETPGADPMQCSIGETCVAGTPRSQSNSVVHYCEPQRFRVDLNLLDLCIKHYLDKTTPVFSGAECSLQRNLNRLLDQNGDARFDLFDLDLCVLAFVEQRGCERDAEDVLHAVDPGVRCCEEDDDCGRGSYCDPQRNICQRDCGPVASREESLGTLDRECTGALQVCHEERGRCETVDVTEQTCEVDQDCPAGAYCFLGHCAPNCYRSTDCPDSGWYCTRTNKCRALPPPEADEGFQFVPDNYAIRFVRDGLRLDAVQNTDSSQLAIMDLVTKRQVFDNSSVAFGYRMEITYGLKQDTACLQPFVDCSDPEQRPPGETEIECTARQDDCLIDPTEEWIRPTSPFGMVSAAGTPSIGVELEESVADDLTPGTYSAEVRLIFDNGDSDTIPVTYTKASPSGEYEGTLTVYMGAVENALNGNRPLQFGMRIKVYPDETRQWNELMAAHELDVDDEGLVDITTGQLVHASLHGDSALAFTRGGAGSDVPDEVHFVGLYSPELGRLRLAGVIDIPADFRIDADGGSCDPDSEALCVRNLFGRDLRRRIEFIGPFEEGIGRFHGIYRETLFGLVPDDGVTLEGGFILDQAVADDSPLPVDSPVAASDVSSFEFPTVTAADLDAEVACQGITSDRVEDALADFSSYIAQAERGGTGTPDNPFGRTTVFPDLVRFRDAIEMALGALDSDNFDETGDPTDVEASPEEISQAHLNVYDFLSDWIVRCDDTDASPPPGCIDEAALRCGLAIHQEAILDGTVDLDAVESPGGSPAGVTPDLFCLDTLPTEGCPSEATGSGFDYSDLFAMQEHNRFWQNLAQVLKFEADRARSDAFLTLFRNEVDPFAQGSALSYKADRLRDAIARYDEVLELVVADIPSSVLFRWPVRAFKQMGNDWLGIMQAVADDRMDAVTELVDLERRVFATTDDDDYRFAHHMMQQEYLLQVYLMVLQARWQEELFAYRGEAGPILERGQHVLSKLNPVKNELGITSNQVFFENSNPDLVNWESYRAALVGEMGDGGLVGDVQGEVGDAVDEMKSALSDLDSLEASIQDSRLELQDTLNEICGDPDLFDPSNGSAPEDYCQQLLKQFDDTDDWIALRDCKFSTDDSDGDESTGASNDGSNDFECPDDTEYTCSTDCTDCDETNCKEIVKTFVLGTDAIEPYIDDDGSGSGTENPSEDIINNPPRCGFEGLESTVSIQGVQRPCVGGEMGDVFAQKALVDRQRRIVIGSVQTLMGEIQASLRMKVKKKQISDTKIGLEFGLFRPLDAALTFATIILKNSIEAGEDVAVSAGCQIIAGFSFGTDCPQKVIAGIFDSTFSLTKGLLRTALLGIQKAAAYSKDLTMTLLDRDIAGAELAAEIEADLREIDGLIDEYNALTQESFNLYVQLRDLRFQAQAAADRFNEEVLFVAQHLVGRESGNLLLGEAMARDASAAFEDVLVLTYKMTMAFVHHYNVPPGEASNLVNEALALVTLDDVKDFVDKLDQRVQQYCGLEGIDCDASNNVEVLRYSLRDQIFPQLQSIVDARTGEVLTAGEQFHNTITSPPYLKRRFRGSKVVDQIEIPVPVPITARRNGDNGPQWLIDPLSCNHMLDARPPQNGATHHGTLAVNVEGQNLGGGERTVHYELVRGPTDFLRACSPESVQTEIGTTPTLDYPIRTWTIGYAPVNPKAQQDDPPAYVSRSNSFSACVNEPEDSGSIDEGNCWRYFARDRSLASLDWKLVIPLQVGDASTANAWIAGEGLSEDQRPIIEDINLYFRYRARPIQEF